MITSLIKPCYQYTLALIAAIVLAFQPQAQITTSVETLKSVWIYQFLNYTTWPQESELKQLTLHYLGDNQEYYQQLQMLTGKKVRGLTIQISQVRLAAEITSPPQALILDHMYNDQLESLRSQFRGQKTLLITDNATNKQDTMINFIQPDKQKLSFELNRYNILFENLAISSDILLIGGTELDIASLLNEQDQKLTARQQQIAAQEQTLHNLQEKVANKEAQVLQQQQALAKQQAQIVAIENEFKQVATQVNELNQQLSASQVKLDTNNQTLLQKQQEVKDKEQNIIAMSKQIQTNKLVLQQQSDTLAKQVQAISKQEQELNNQIAQLSSQSSTIRLQYIVMVVSFALIALIMLIVVVLLRNSRAKKRVNLALRTSNEQLEQANKDLRNAQKQLVEAEKMAALGNLVAGVAHEINTPLGISVTSASFVSDKFAAFHTQYQANQLTRKQMDKFVGEFAESLVLINRNLSRASELVRQFKQVAVDQSNDEIREFELCEYLNEIMSSLYPQYRKLNCQVTIACNEIMMKSYPGVIAQLVTNLVMNSIVHAFDENSEDCQISLTAVEEQDTVKLIYQDNGIGIAEDKREKIFAPFYTTKRNKGGSGLGLHICYNLVHQKLAGEITCVASSNGAKFEITTPKHLVKNLNPN